MSARVLHQGGKVFLRGRALRLATRKLATFEALALELGAVTSERAQIKRRGVSRVAGVFRSSPNAVKISAATSRSLRTTGRCALITSGKRLVATGH